MDTPLKGTAFQRRIGAILAYLSIGLQSVIGIALTPFIIRKLGDSGYGLYALAHSLITYLSIFDFGFSSSVIRFTAKCRHSGSKDDEKQLLGFYLKIYFVLSLLVVVFGSIFYFLTDMLFSNKLSIEELSDFKKMQIIVIANAFIAISMSVFASIVQAYEHFIFYKSSFILKTLANAIIMFILLICGRNATELLLSTLICNCCFFITMALYAFLKLKIGISLCNTQHAYCKEIVSYSFFTFLGIITTNIYWNSGQFVLGSLSGTNAVALYSIAIQLESAFTMFSTAIVCVFLPKITYLAEMHEDKQISDIFIKIGRIQYIIMSFVLFGFIVFGRSFICLWVGKEYLSAYWISLLFLGALMIPLIQNLGITILQARNQLKFRAIMLLTLALVCFGLQIAGTFIAGIWGCAFATTVTLLVGQGLIMNLYYMKFQRIDIILFWKEIMKLTWKPALLTIIAYVIMNSLAVDSWMFLMLSISFFSIIYWGINYWMNLSCDDRQMIWQLIRKKSP